jgi:hypothetical protein
VGIGDAIGSSVGAGVVVGAGTVAVGKLVGVGAKVTPITGVTTVFGDDVAHPISTALGSKPKALHKNNLRFIFGGICNLV